MRRINYDDMRPALIWFFTKILRGTTWLRQKAWNQLHRVTVRKECTLCGQRTK